MLATGNIGDWHAIIGEVAWSSVLKTTMDCHSELVLHSNMNTNTINLNPRYLTLTFLRNARQETPGYEKARVSK